MRTDSLIAFALLVAMLIAPLGCTPSTPESCWESLEFATAKHDTVGILKCLATEDRLISLGGLAYEVESLIVFRTPSEQKALALLKRHGIDGLDIMGALQIEDSPGGSGADAVFTGVGQKIKNPFAFAKEATELIGAEAEPHESQFPTRSALTLSKVIVSGQTATGMVSSADSEDTSPVDFAVDFAVHFVLEDGTWKITNYPKSTDSH
jgi:hypothetical protein